MDGEQGGEEDEDEDSDDVRTPLAIHMKELTPLRRTLRLSWNSPRGLWTSGASFVCHHSCSLTASTPL